MLSDILHKIRAQRDHEPTVISVGQIWVDITMHVQEMPQPGEFTNAPSVTKSASGSFHVLQAASRMGARTELASIMGTGPWATMLRDSLRRSHILHTGPTRPNQDNGFRIVLTDGMQKSYVAHHGAEAHGDPRAFAHVRPQRGDVVHISGNALMNESSLAVNAFIQQPQCRPQEREFRMVINPTNTLRLVNDQLLENLVLTRPIWSMNRQEARTLAYRLGVTFDDAENPTATTFKVSAPTSTKLVLNLYRSGDDQAETVPYATHEMQKGEKGVFSCTVAEDLDGVYYTYTVTNAKGTNEVVDPYARSAGVNGRRGMVVNFARLNAGLPGWDADVRPFRGKNVDAVIYEAHVRDLTISPTSGLPEAVRGKFLGLADESGTYTENGVTVSTGLAHLRELGVTHVQLQPFYDYSSVDERRSGSEMSDDNYNWGYDPQNYNVLEGSYSTDPFDGYSRIRECKQMILAMHRAGICVNMDVVYNHTASSENSNLNLLVPYYYYRTRANGAFYNGSGCGNEVASERFMVNKFIRESCRFWIEEYHLSGFRFDLMGLIDNQTMIDVYRDCVALDPQIMIYGEPWTGGASKLKAGVSDTQLREQTTVQESLAQDFFCGSGVRVGAFNDVIRNAIRGSNNPGKGYVQGSAADASQVAMCVAGLFSRSTVKTQEIDPNQVLNYVSCHDNYTLYDQLVQTMPEARLAAAYTQADAVVFLAQGVPFIQEGEEFMRSKYDPETGTYEGNSYNVGDRVNAMDYALKIRHADVFRKTQELIAFRLARPELRLATRQEITDALSEVETDGGNLRYTVGGLTVIHTVSGMTAELPGTFRVLYSNLRAAGEEADGSITLLPNESVVLEEVR